MSFEPAAKSGVPGAVARPAAPRTRSAALRRRPRREVSQRFSSASAVIRCCSRASEIDRSRASSFSRAPTRSAMMRSRTATSSRRKAMPSCCSRTTASRRRISLARAVMASPEGAPLTPSLSRRERGAPDERVEASAIKSSSKSRVADFPGVLEGDLASLRDDRFAVRFADDALEGGDEFVGRVVERDDVGVGLELRQAAGDDGLSRREVLVELDGVGRLGQRRAQERESCRRRSRRRSRPGPRRALRRGGGRWGGLRGSRARRPSCRRRARSSSPGACGRPARPRPASNHAAIAP